MSPYGSHRTWYGVNCDETNDTVKWVLRSNGLSGTLSDAIANVSSLVPLDVSDNDIQASGLSAVTFLGFVVLIELQLDCPSVTQWDIVITFAAEVRF